MLHQRAFLPSVATAIVMILTLFSPEPARADIGPVDGVCRVNANGPAPFYSQDGLTWDTAYTDLQVAFSNSGCLEFWVAQGVYKPGTFADSYFQIPYRNGLAVALYGGFDGTETARTQRDWTQHVTILSGDIDSNDLDPDGNHIDESAAQILGTNSQHVVLIYGLNGPGTRLDGFTITGGDAVNGSSVVSGRGGGLLCIGSSASNQCNPTFQNLVFSGNRAHDRGGAIDDEAYQGGESSPTYTNVVFHGNQAAYGGAVYNLADPTSNPTFTNVTFSNNTADQQGGAIYNDGSYNTASSPSFTNVTFSNNTAVNDEGGAVFNNGSYGGISNPIFKDVTFNANQASEAGGAVSDHGVQGASNPTFANVTFSGNSARNGGAVANNGQSGVSSPTFLNVTFGGNHADTWGGAIASYGGPGGSSYTLLGNVILWGDSAGGSPEVWNNEATANLWHSVVQGGL